MLAMFCIFQQYQLCGITSSCSLSLFMKSYSGGTLTLRCWLDFNQDYYHNPKWIFWLIKDHDFPIRIIDSIIARAIMILSRRIMTLEGMSMMGLKTKRNSKAKEHPNLKNKSKKLVKRSQHLKRAELSRFSACIPILQTAIYMWFSYNSEIICRWRCPWKMYDWTR